MRKIERNNSADTRVIEEGREEGAPGARAEVPQQSMEKIMGWSYADCTPAHHGGLQWSRDIGSEVEPRNKERARGKCFNVCSYFSLFYSDLFGNRLN